MGRKDERRRRVCFGQPPPPEAWQLQHTFRLIALIKASSRREGTSRVMCHIRRRRSRGRECDGGVFVLITHRPPEALQPPRLWKGVKGDSSRPPEGNVALQESPRGGTSGTNSHTRLT